MDEWRPPVWPGWNTVQKIGRGSCGTVYRIERDMLGETESAALKFISIPRDPSEIDELRFSGENTESITRSFQSQMESLINEYRLMKRLANCPNVVRCDDVEYVQHPDGIGWDILIRMEFLTPLMKSLGDDLRTPDETVIRLGEHICRALVECAKCDIIHRDIKPQNIFLSDDGVFKLGDFGVARVMERNSTATARTGTFGYMAPEVYFGKHYGVSADIYSLGLVLYWLLNERKGPFQNAGTADEREEAMRRRMNGEPIPAPKHGSEALQKIVKKACRFEPEKRYQTAAEMLADLEALDMPAGPKPVKKLPLARIAGAALCLVALTVLLTRSCGGSAPLKSEDGKPSSVPAAVSAEPVSPEPTTAPAPAAQAESNIDWSLTDGVLTIRGEGPMPDYDAASSRAPWYEFCDDIRSAVIEHGVTSIGGGAFFDCRHLESLTISNSVLTLGRQAFSDCEALRDVYFSGTKNEWNSMSNAGGNGPLGDAVIHFGSSGPTSSPVPTATPVPTDAPTATPGPTPTQVPAQAKKGLSYSLDNGVLTIRGAGPMPDYTNDGKNDPPWSKHRADIEAVIIEKGVTSIGAYAFERCSVLKSITIPDGIVSIGAFAFFDCSALTGVTIPKTVTSIGNRALAGCGKLASISVAKENTAYKTVDGALFDMAGTTLIRCPSVYNPTSFTIPRGVKSIADSAFDKCPGLKTIIIPDSVTSIGDYAFFDCSSLTELAIPKGVKSIGICLFYGCSSLKSVSIPESVTSIGASAFYESGIERLTIPKNVASIGKNAFYSCERLVRIDVAEGNAAYKSVDGVLFNAAGTELICYPPRKNAAEYAVPEGVVTVADCAFLRCSDLKKVTLPKGVKTIGESVFYESGIERLTIPKNVSSIGKYTFYRCESLAQIDVAEGNTAYKSVGGVLFNAAGTELICYPPRRNEAEYAVPKGVVTIADCAFNRCTSLYTVSIPDSVTNISEFAFDACRGLTNVTIPENVSSLGRCAFQNCSALKSVTIQSVKIHIGKKAFLNCKELTDVYFKGSQKQWTGLTILGGNDRLIKAKLHYNS